MPRLIDDIRAQGKFQKPTFVSKYFESQWAEYAKGLWAILMSRDLPIIGIDNVAEYYYQNDQEYWDLREDFPSLAPPFPQFWMENKMPRTIYSKEKGTTDLLFKGREGVLITALEPADMEFEFPTEIHPEAKWILACEMWMDMGGDVAGVGPHAPTFLNVSADGKLLQVPWTKPFTDDPVMLEVMKSLSTWFRPAFLAISFLHCKNVVLKDERVDKPVAKKWHSKTGLWPTPYKTLVIEPLKQILRKEGRDNEVGLAKAMHICRGHFADYREGRGLFGKYKKLVWIPMTVKGNKGLKPPPRVMEVKL